jgi:hypothetical protein
VRIKPASCQLLLLLLLLLVLLLLPLRPALVLQEGAALNAPQLLLPAAQHDSPAPAAATHSLF